MRIRFNPYLLSTSYMPGTVLGSADASVSKPVQDICPYRASILVEKSDNKERKNSCQVVMGKEKSSRIRWTENVKVNGERLLFLEGWSRKMSLIRWHLSRDWKELRELALRLFRGRTNTGEFPWAGPGPMCLRTNREDSFMEWRDKQAPGRGWRSEVPGACWVQPL